MGAREARAQIPAVLDRLREAGALNDALFASGRVQRLARSGRSRQAIEAHLAARGVGRDARAEAVAGAQIDELLAALLTARRRRMGPFRIASLGADSLRRDAAALGRAGFPEHIVRQAMRLTREEAARIIDRARGEESGHKRAASAPEV